MVLRSEEFEQRCHSARESIRAESPFIEKVISSINRDALHQVDAQLVLDALHPTVITSVVHSLKESLLTIRAARCETEQKSSPIEDSILEFFLAQAFAIFLLVLCGVMAIKGRVAMMRIILEQMRIIPKSEKLKKMIPKKPKRGLDSDIYIEELAKYVEDYKCQMNNKYKYLRRMMTELKNKSRKNNSEKKDVRVKPENDVTHGVDVVTGDPEDSDGATSEENCSNIVEKRGQHMSQETNTAGTRTAPTNDGIPVFSGHSLASSTNSPARIPAGNESTIKGRTEVDSRTRYDLVIKKIKLDLQVETLTTNDGVKHYGDTTAIGPKGFSVTWRAMASLIHLYSGILMPMSRVEKMLGAPFDRALVTRCIAEFARSFQSIYKYMANHIIANACYLNCDDGHTRVNDVTRLKINAKNRQREAQKNLLKIGLLTKEDYDNATENDWVPIKGWTNDTLIQEANDLSSLFPESKADAGEPKINEVKSKKDKKPESCKAFIAKAPFIKQNSDGTYSFNVVKNLPRLQTSVIICEDNDYNPNAESRYEIKGQPPITFENVARIVFYRTDFKSLGLFLSDLFKHRSDKNESVTIQSDLSKENRVPDDAGVPVKVAGCMAHARRPFFRFRDMDPEFCDMMLDQFALLSRAEEIINGHWFTPEKMVELRKENEGMVWRMMLQFCRVFQDKWSAHTELGSAIDYMLNNQRYLMHYLDDPNVALTNNVAEQCLRGEALHDSASFGCATLEGRIRFDLARTAYASSCAAGINTLEYFVFVMIASDFDKEKNPKHYTPMGYKTWSETSIASGQVCPCCKKTFSQESTQVSTSFGIKTCYPTCALSAAKRAAAILAVEY